MGAFWVFFCFHILTKYATHGDEQLKEWLFKGDTVLSISWSNLKLIAAMTTFFQVFYTNQCFNRYERLYNNTRRMMSLCYDLALHLRLNIGDASRPHTRLAMRY